MFCLFQVAHGKEYSESQNQRNGFRLIAKNHRVQIDQ